MSKSGRAAAASIRQKAQDATIKLRGAGQDLLAGPQVCTVLALICNLRATSRPLYSAVTAHSTRCWASRWSAATGYPVS